MLIVNLLTFKDIKKKKTPILYDWAYITVYGKGLLL